uniref:Acyl-CoA binding domain containing 7 n=1 Tax=Astyanax mexicanus TaxID=7994 RepID=A0A8B9RDY7_ASTMX
MTLQEEFEKYADDVKKVKTRPTDQELLDMYGLYKQAIVGDINIDKPGITDLKGKAKWQAWNSRKVTLWMKKSMVLEKTKHTANGKELQKHKTHPSKWQHRHVQRRCHDCLHWLG